MVSAGVQEISSQQGLWWRWRGYAVRWLLFCEIVQLFQPVSEDGLFWQEKLEQALLGLVFGALCALVFTAAENHFNQARLVRKTWLMVVAMHHATITGSDDVMSWPAVKRMTKILQTVDRYTAAMSPRKSRAGRTARDSVRAVVVQVHLAMLLRRTSGWAFMPLWL